MIDSFLIESAEVQTMPEHNGKRIRILVDFFKCKRVFTIDFSDFDFFAGPSESLFEDKLSKFTPDVLNRYYYISDEAIQKELLEALKTRLRLLFI